MIIMKIRTSDLDAVAPLHPVNATAGRVASKGEFYAYQYTDGKAAYEAPPPLGQMPLGKPGFVDLTGTKVGRLTVIGYLRKHLKDGEGRWLVRCVCGRYEERRTKVLKSPYYAKIASCDPCNHLRRVRLGIHGPKKRIAPRSG